MSDKKDHSKIGKRLTEALYYLKKNMIIKAEREILEGLEYIFTPKK